MVFWTGATAVNAANLARLGPAVQGFVGTEGAYTDLYAAMGDPGGPQWRRVVVVPGATLTTDLNISSADYGCIIGAGLISLGGTAKLNLGNCSYWNVSGLRFNSTVTTNGQLNLFGTGDGYNRIENCIFDSSDSQGLYIANHHVWVIDCVATGATLDGIQVAAACAGPVWINSCESVGNGRVGIDDMPDLCHISDCVVTGNVTAQIQSSSSYLDNNQVA